jgi:ABC-type sugar transport system ATPase subunit
VTTPAVALCDVAKRFASHQAVGGVTLDVAVTESVVILGPSGCGKTTLLRLIAGLEVPVRSGSVRFKRAVPAGTCWHHINDSLAMCFRISPCGRT